MGMQGEKAMKPKTSVITKPIKPEGALSTNLKAETTAILETTTQMATSFASTTGNTSLMPSGKAAGTSTCPSHPLILMSVLACVTSLCAILAVVALCCLRKRQKQDGRASERAGNEGLDGNATYMELMTRKQEFTMTGPGVENRTYDVTDGNALTVAVNLEQGIRREKAKQEATNKSVRYSITPTVTSSTDQSDQGGVPPHMYEEVNCNSSENGMSSSKEKGDDGTAMVNEKNDDSTGNPMGDRSNLKNRQVGYEEYNPASKEAPCKNEISDANKHTYVSVNYSNDDSVEKWNTMTTDSDEDSVNAISNNDSRESKPKPDMDDKGKPNTENGGPLYFTLAQSQPPNIESKKYECPVVKVEMANRPTSVPLAHEVTDKASAEKTGLSSSLNYLDATTLEPRLDLGGINAAMLGGRPRAWSERGTVGTGNTYQQLPLASPNMGDENVYQKLDRGFLAKTLSHP